MGIAQHFVWSEPSSASPVLLNPGAFVLAADATGAPQESREAGDRAELQARRKTDFEKTVQPILAKYCFECHGTDPTESELSFASIESFEAASAQRETWEKTLKLLEASAMPPQDHEPRPSNEQTKQLIDWINLTFFYVDCSAPVDPGHVTIRRLNRNEYDNTIRDLVGVEFQPAEDFPSDDVGNGFDNMGAVLSLPPLLMEKYIDAAQRIAEAAIIVGDESRFRVRHIEAKQLMSTSGAAVNSYGYRPLSSKGSVFAEFNIGQAGEYVVRIEAAAQQAGPEPAKMEVSVGGKSLKVHEIKGHIQPGRYEVRFTAGPDQDVKIGKHRVEGAFINDYYRPKAEDPKDRDRNLFIQSIEVEGPPGSGKSAYPESHGRIVFVTPDETRSVRAAAIEVLRRFTTRAFRRRVTDGEIEGLVQLVENVVGDGEPFELGIQIAVEAVLVSPRFLFRVETDAVATDTRAVRRLNDYELATRLSYFLWSSMPDDELFSLADKGVLHQPDVLEEQVRRMLGHPEKAQTLVVNFGGQWLNLRNLDEAEPNGKMFKSFNDELRSDMHRETELLFETIMRENKSVLDFLDADYTFVNERLAKHYSIEGITGSEFQKVSLADSKRAGVLTHASILTLTSDPARTLPVKRGKWILENILGTPPPPPPAGVPELAEAQKANPDATLREQLAQHREDPACAVCHVSMDPLGIGLENFDAIGRWRDKDGEKPIDSSGTLPGGASFTSPREMIALIRKREADFAQHLTRKMMTYALGRGLEYYDRCVIERIVAALAADDYRFHTLVTQIVKSEPFTMRRPEGEQQ